MGRQKSKITPTILQCPECDNKLQIWRKTAKQKLKGHTKHMWCPYCQKVVGFIELKNCATEDGWYSLAGKVEIDG